MFMSNGVFGVGQSIGVMQIHRRPPLVAMATNSLKSQKLHCD